MPQQRNQTQAVQLEAASVGQRILAFMLDLIPLFIMAGFLMTFLKEQLLSHFLNNVYSAPGEYYSKAYFLSRASININSLMIATGFAYMIMLEQSAWHATICKRILRIQVINLEYKPPTMRQSVIRNLGKSLLLFGGMFFVWLADVLFIDFLLLIGVFGSFVAWLAFGALADRDQHKQFFYDKWAGTYVVKRP